MKKLLSVMFAIILASSMTFGLVACGIFDSKSKPGNNNVQTTPEDDDSNTEDEQIQNATDYLQTLDYSESIAEIQNPDQGFYTPINVSVSTTGVNYSISATTKLVHLRFDLSNFSAKAGGNDAPLTTEALNGIKNVFKDVRNRDKNAIVRFCYDRGYGGNSNFEPPLDVMLNHARQFCPIVEQYSSVVTALELGMVGPWGEMHTSSAANSVYINALIQEFLDHTSTVPVTVRTPKMIYDYLGITVDKIDSYTMPESAYRLGMYNDGYLGSNTDLGTYTYREKEVAFIAKQNAHLPYGGEVVEPSSTLHNITSCLPEMYKIHLSYLNEFWNNTVINKWKTTNVDSGCAKADAAYYGQTAYMYIKNHMGYRFVLTNSTFTHAENLDKLQISLTLKNVGFGNMNKAKHAKLLFTDKSDAVKYRIPVKDFTGADNVKYIVNLSTYNIKSGSYRVYLQLYGDYITEQDIPIYSVQFANNGIYKTALKANKIGEIDIPAENAA